MTFIGMMTGAVAGLATITPAAGYVSLSTAMPIGFNTGIIRFQTVRVIQRKHWDDAPDVWGIHGMGGVLGSIMHGLFANKAVNSNGVDGLLPVRRCKKMQSI